MEVFLGILFIIFVFYAIGRAVEKLEIALRSISESMKVVAPIILSVFLTGYFLAFGNNKNPSSRDLRIAQPYIDNSCTQKIVDDIKNDNEKLTQHIYDLKKEIQNKESSTLLDNLKIAYIGIIGGWVFSILLPAESFFRLDNNKIKNTQKIKIPIYSNATFLEATAEIQKTVLNISLSQPDKTNIKMGVLIIFAEKMIRISLVIIISSAIFISIEYISSLF